MGVRGAARRSRKSPFHQSGSKDIGDIYRGRDSHDIVKINHHFQCGCIEGDPQVVIIVVLNVAISGNGSNRSGNQVSTKVVIRSIFLDANVVVPGVVLGTSLIRVHFDNDAGINCRGEKIAAESHQAASPSNVSRIACFENKCHSISSIIGSSKPYLGLHFPIYVGADMTDFPDGTALTRLILSQSITAVTEVCRVVVQGELCLCG